MGRGHFRNTLSAPFKKNTDAEAAAKEGVISTETTNPPADEKKDGAAEKAQNPPREVFDDVTVCNYLRIRRRVLDAARTASARGKGWDCVDDQAGMTKAWIDAYALEHHIVPNFAVQLKSIMPGNKVASVRLIATHQNLEMCGVEKLSDGSRAYAHVRNLMQYPIHFREGFDCLIVGSRLEWTQHLNQVKY